MGESTYESGAPTYYYSVLSINGYYAGDVISLHDMRFSYLYYGLHPGYGTTFTLSDAQFIHCVYGFQPEYMDCYLNNVLMSDVGTAFNGAYYTLTGTHMTVDGCSSSLAEGWYGDPAGCGVAFYNSLLVNIADFGSVGVTTNYTAILGSSTGVFQSVGGGNYYLADGTYRNAGTTNIDASILADIATKTTYPPDVHSNETFLDPFTFGIANVQRDNDTPDLGYHYDPMDYVFGGCDFSNNMTFSAGTVVGWFHATSGFYHAGHGIHIGDGYQPVELRVNFQPCNFSWVKFSKSSMGTAVTAVSIGAEIRPVGAWPSARSLRAGLFARLPAAYQAAASRTMRSRL